MEESNSVGILLMIWTL